MRPTTFSAVKPSASLYLKSPPCSVRVAERAKQEGGVHLRGALCLRLESGRGRAGGQLVVVQILHVRCFPAFEVGERRGVGERLGVSLLAEQTDEHDGCLCAGRGAVEFVQQVRRKRSHRCPETGLPRADGQLTPVKFAAPAETMTPAAARATATAAEL